MEKPDLWVSVCTGLGHASCLESSLSIKSQKDRETLKVRGERPCIWEKLNEWSSHLFGISSLPLCPPALRLSTREKEGEEQCQSHLRYYQRGWISSFIQQMFKWHLCDTVLNNGDTSVIKRTRLSSWSLHCSRERQTSKATVHQVLISGMETRKGVGKAGVGLVLPHCPRQPWK